MKISDLAIDKLHIGKPVINYKGTPGRIAGFLEDREDVLVVIQWANGKESVVWHFQCEKIY